MSEKPNTMGANQVKFQDGKLRARSSLAASPCYRLLDTDDIIRSDDEFLEDDAEHWSRIDWDHSWNAGHRWHSGLKPMRRIIQR